MLPPIGLSYVFIVVDFTFFNCLNHDSQDERITRIEKIVLRRSSFELASINYEPRMMRKTLPGNLRDFINFSFFFLIMVILCRVGTADRSAIPPSERSVRLSPHPAQAVHSPIVTLAAMLIYLMYCLGNPELKFIHSLVHSRPLRWEVIWLAVFIKVSSIFTMNHHDRKSAPFQIGANFELLSHPLQVSIRFLHVPVPSKPLSTLRLSTP